MQYLLLFLEGIITFISPCLLPMLPVYVSFFAAGRADRRGSLLNSVGFVCGFTIVFVLMGAFAGTIGRLLTDHTAAVNVVTGLIVILLGLNFTGFIRIGFLNRTIGKTANVENLNLFRSIIFGVVFSIGWTPCVGAFLGSALMMAAGQGGTVKGILMLLVYSIGLGIPFVVSALLIDRIKGAFDFIKRNYKIINIASGLLLVAIGVSMIVFALYSGADKQINLDSSTSVSDENRQKAPDFAMTDSDGKSVKISDFTDNGRSVVLNFWASWCPPCKKEMPDFEKVYRELGDDVQFIMLCLTDGTRETKESGERFIESQGYTFPVFFDTNQNGASAYAIRSIPVTVFIDKDGYITNKRVGAINERILREGIDS